jgi:hypothetical protein
VAFCQDCDLCPSDFLEAFPLRRVGQLGMSCTARIERALFHRARSASKQGRPGHSIFPSFPPRTSVSQQGSLDWFLTARIEGAHSDRAHSGTVGHTGFPNLFFSL